MKKNDEDMERGGRDIRTERSGKRNEMTIAEKPASIAIQKN